MIETMDYFKNMICKIPTQGKTFSPEKLKYICNEIFEHGTQFSSYIISTVTKERLNFCQMLLFTIPWKLNFGQVL